MRQTSIILQTYTDGGTVKMRPYKGEEAVKHGEFLASFVGADRPAFILASYREITQEHMQFLRRRDHYWAYLHTLIKDGLQSWTDAIPGKTLAEKADALHVGMKKAYCDARAVEMFSFSDAECGNGKNKKGLLKMPYPEAKMRMEWIMRELFDAHMKLTEAQPGGAWAPAPFREME